MVVQDHRWTMNTEIQFCSTGSEEIYEPALEQSHRNSLAERENEGEQETKSSLLISSFCSHGHGQRRDGGSFIKIKTNNKYQQPSNQMDSKCLQLGLETRDVSCGLTQGRGGLWGRDTEAAAVLPFTKIGRAHV